MGNSQKIEELKREIHTALNSTEIRRDAWPTEIAKKLCEAIDFERAGISVKEVEWLCGQRLGEMYLLLDGKKSMADIRVSLKQDSEARYPKGYYEEGRWGLG